MANKEPETMLGNVRKTLTGNGTKNPTLENMLGLDTNKKKSTKKKKR